jgi:hypothetical protein
MIFVIPVEVEAGRAVGTGAGRGGTGAGGIGRGVGRGTVPPGRETALPPGSKLVGAPKAAATVAGSDCPPAAITTDGTATNASKSASKRAKVRNEARIEILHILQITRWLRFGKPATTSIVCPIVIGANQLRGRCGAWHWLRVESRSTSTKTPQTGEK